MWLQGGTFSAKMGTRVCSNLSVLLLVLLVGTVRCRQKQMPLRHTPAELIKSNGYPSEVHKVTTPDGYVLQVDRMPRHGRPVVFIANQLFSSASSYLLLGKGKAIGFLLYDAGFDVWLGNYRGTDFSLTNTRLSSSDDKFWEFGWHEQGAIDNPTIIDFVLKKSGQRDLVYMGHSMGSTTFFVTASERPDMLKKIRAAFLMAPVVFLEHHKSRTIRFLQPFTNLTQSVVDHFHLHKQPVEAIRKALQRVCGKVLLRGLCAKFGLGSEDVLLPEFAIFYPAGGSMGQLLHYLQLANPKWPGFRKFNYGASKNRARYGTSSPPDYKLSHITTPVYMYNGKADEVCAAQDLETLKRRLRNVKKLFFSRNPKFNHRDFVLSNTAVVDLWQEVLNDLKPYIRK